MPTEEAATLALRTQQIIAYESGAANVVDPLGGSYYVEYLTDEMERRAMEYIDRIDQMGGMVAAVERGFPQQEIAKSAYEFQKAVDSGERVIVGVNKFQSEEEEPIPILKIDPEVERRQVQRVREFRARRDKAKWAEGIERVKDAARGSDNIMEAVVHAVKAGATLGEISDCFREVFGVYRESTAVC